MLPVVSLAIVSVLAGVGLLAMFRRTVDHAAVTAIRKRVRAHLMELMLFTDEPVLIWKAHTNLIGANLRYLALMLRPVLISSIPMLLLLANLDAFYGKSPLVPGQEAVITMKLKGPLDPAAPPPALRASPEVAVETPAVRDFAERQVSWRIRATHAGSGRLEMTLPEGMVAKNVEVGSGIRQISERRVSSVLEYLWNPGERFFSSPTVDWIEIRYPTAAVQGFGLELHWLVWFTLFSLASMLLLKRRFNVTF